MSPPCKFLGKYLGHSCYCLTMFYYDLGRPVLRVQCYGLPLGGDHLASSSSSCLIFQRSASFSSALSRRFSGLLHVGHLKKFSMASSKVLVRHVAVPQ